MSPINLVLTRLQRVKKTRLGWTAPCPAHDDRNPSLSISEGDDGRVLIKCFAGCTSEAICAAIDLELKDLFPANSQRPAAGGQRDARDDPKSKRRTFSTVEDATAAALDLVKRKRGDPWSLAHTHIYRDRDGRELMRVLRFESDESGAKTFTPLRPGNGGWQIGDPPKPLPLYRIFENQNPSVISVHEGELCCNTAALLGQAATTSAHGANCPQNSDWRPLLDDTVKEIHVYCDNDDAGRLYARRVVDLVRAQGSTAIIKIIVLPGLPEGGDLVDFVGAQRALGRDDNEIKAAIATLIANTQPEPVHEAPIREPRRKKLPPYIPFAVDLLPEPLRTYVITASASIGCDSAYVALPLLAAAAAAIGNTRRIRLKRGWSEPSIIWALLLALSGQLKSPAINITQRIVDDLQRRLLKEHEQDLERFKSKLDAYEVRRRAWIKKGGEGDPPEAPVEPVASRLYCSDTTIEALAMILLRQPRGVLLLRDELSGWLTGFDQYRQGRGGDAAYWLEMHGGRPILVDRKSGDPKTIHVKHASVSIAGGMQPRVLGRSLGAKHFENGLAARFLIVMPPRSPRRWTEAEIPPDCEDGLQLIFERLYSLKPDVDADGDVVPRDVELTENAKDRWISFFNEHGEQQVAMSGNLAAAWSKLEGYAARLALVIHYLRWAGGEAADDPRIDEQSARAGIELSRWFGGEAKRVYAALRETDEDQDLRELAEAVRRKGGSVSVRTWQRVRTHATADDAEAELQRLVEAGFGAWVHVAAGPSGGRPSKLFQLDPEAPDSETPDGGAESGVVSVSEVAGDERHGDREPPASVEPDVDARGSVESSDRTPSGEASQGVSSEADTHPSRLQAETEPSAAVGSDTDKTPRSEPVAGVSSSGTGLDEMVALVEQTFADCAPREEPPPAPTSSSSTASSPTRPPGPPVDPPPRAHSLELPFDAADGAGGWDE